MPHTARYAKLRNRDKLRYSTRADWKSYRAKDTVTNNLVPVDPINPFHNPHPQSEQYITAHPLAEVSHPQESDGEGLASDGELVHDEEQIESNADEDLYQQARHNTQQQAIHGQFSYPPVRQMDQPPAVLQQTSYTSGMRSSLSTAVNYTATAGHCVKTGCGAVRDYAHENPCAVCQYAFQTGSLIATSVGIANPSIGTAIASTTLNGLAYLSSGGKDVQRYNKGRQDKKKE